MGVSAEELRSRRAGRHTNDTPRACGTCVAAAVFRSRSLLLKLSTLSLTANLFLALKTLHRSECTVGVGDLFTGDLLPGLDFGLTG